MKRLFSLLLVLIMISPVSAHNERQMERKIVYSQSFQKYLNLKDAEMKSDSSESMEEKLAEFKNAVSEDEIWKKIPLEYKKEADSIKEGLLNSSEITELEEYESRFLILQTSVEKYQNEKLLQFITILIIVLSIFVISTIYAAISYFDSHRQQLGAASFAKKVIQIQENERKNISHELHDTVVQELKGIKLVTSQLEENIKDENIKNLLSDANRVSDSAISHLRTICYNLTPPELEYGNISDSIGQLCRNFSKETGITCPVVITEPELLNSYTSRDQLNIFRIIQEALTNIKKHAEASEVSVLIRKADRENFLLIISDDGIGFDIKNREIEDGSHFGLLSIKDRVSSLNGKLNIHSEKDFGTEIKVILPVKQEREK